MLFSLYNKPFELIVYVLVIGAAITVHEFFHAWTAARLGDYTAKYQGRISLNPSKHIDPLGLILLFVAGFGWGKPVQVNTNALKGKYDELKISLAGPASNVVFAIISTMVLMVPVLVINKFYPDYNSSNFVEDLMTIIEINLVINCSLALFNLIPIPPLDGSKIFRAIAPYRWHDKINQYEKIGTTILLLLVFSQYLIGFDLLGSTLTPAVMWLFHIISAFSATAISSLLDIIQYIASIF